MNFWQGLRGWQRVPVILAGLGVAAMGACTLLVLSMGLAIG